MKSILGTVLLAVVTCLPLVSASAQDRQVTATIPFNFVVGSSSLPAGTYLMNPVLNNHFLQLRELSHKVNAVAIDQPDAYSSTTANTLIFHRIGNQYFLHRMCISDASHTVVFPETKAEKMARRRNDLAGMPTQDPVLVAMN